MCKLTFKFFILLLLVSSSLFSREIDLDAIAKQSLKTHKHLFIFLHKTGCPYCENMREFTLDDTTIDTFIKKHFIYIDINVSEKDSVTFRGVTGSGEDFAKYIGYNFYPSSLFFNGKLQLVYAIPGYQEEENFISMLNYVYSKAYEHEEYAQYYKTHKFKI